MDMLLFYLLMLSSFAYVFNSEASALSVVTAEGFFAPVDVAVYYETLCPSCRAFVTEQLLPAYVKGPELMNLTLIPYGNAQMTKTDKGYKFYCQHGPTECEGNKVHSCAVSLVKNEMLLMKYVACMITNDTDPDAVGKKCAYKFGIPWKPISKCSKGNQGNELLKKNGDLTDALGSQLTGVPAITFNGEMDDQLAVINNFWDELCKQFPDPKPVKCLQEYYYVSERSTIPVKNNLN